MLVSELIEKLKKVPQDLPCGTYDDVRITLVTGVEITDNDSNDCKIKDKKIVIIY